VGERTRYEPGTFSWVDCSTSDSAAGQAFYEGLFGWEGEVMPAGDSMTYTMFRKGGHYVAAVSNQMEQERSMGIPPHWNSYVTVEEAERSAERAKELGGNAMMEPFDVLESGRMAVIADPTGAVFSIWEPRDHIGAGLVNDVGALSWNELNTKDLQTARDFYAGLFGWDYEEAREDYLMILNGGSRNGGIRAQSEQEAEIPPHWLSYFTVESTDDAVRQAEAAGAGAMMPPMDVGMGRIAVLRDPQGAAFAVFQGQTDP
jgi:uncharacterized protein